MDFRPQTLKDYIGQNALKIHLSIMMRAAASRNEQLGHLLVYSQAGFGKTTIANIIANEIGGKFIQTTGMNLQTNNDILQVLLALNPGDVLFVDEVHKAKSFESLFTALEDNRVDITITDSKKKQKTISYILPAFTLIAATTTLGNIPKPMIDRFAFKFNLEPYTQSELETITSKSASRIGLKVDAGGVAEIAKRSRGTPRIVNNYLNAIRDYTQVAGTPANKKFVEGVFEQMRVDSIGLEEIHRKILKGLIEKFGGEPVGLDTLCASLGEDSATVQDQVEPYLLELGFVNITKRGRVAMPAAYKHLGLTVKSQTFDLGV